MKKQTIDIKNNTESSDSLKNLNLEDILKTVESKFGKGTLMELSNNKNLSTNVFSTGIYTLDHILGIKGLPRGRIIELFGPESSGKTTLALAIASIVQQNNGLVAFIDAEHALDIEHVKKLKVDPSKLMISQPDYGEQALDLVNYLCEIGKLDLIIVDSVASLVPKAEIEGEIQDQSIGLQARMMSKAMRVIVTNAAKSGTTIIFINQLREKIGIAFGNPEITPGGRSLKFYSSVRIDVRLKERIKKNNLFVGQLIKIKIVKNKLSSPYRETEVILNYENGINYEEDYINYLLCTEQLVQKGSWIYQNDKAIGKGKSEAFKNIEKNLLK